MTEEALAVMALWGVTSLVMLIGIGFDKGRTKK